MKARNKTLTIIFIIIIILIVLFWAWGSYNKLVASNEKVEGNWAQVETQYQRRFDLIPNLVDSVKGIMAQEQEVFNNLAQARASYTGARTLNQKVEAATQVEGALGRLLAIMENYPELRSAESVNNLMTQLEGTENRISVARTRFNEEVRIYNTMIKQVPRKMIANWFNFHPREYFEITPEASEVPQVDL